MAISPQQALEARRDSIKSFVAGLENVIEAAMRAQYAEGQTVTVDLSTIGFDIPQNDKDFVLSETLPAFKKAGWDVAIEDDGKRLVFSATPTS